MTIRVLYIENDPDDARLIEAELRSATSQTVVQLERADSLEAGLECLGRNKIEAVLLDLSRPERSGYELLRHLLAHAPHLPVIVITDQADEEMEIKALQAGAQDYLVKGQVDGRLLLRSIQYAIQRKQVEQALLESESRYRTLFEGSPVSIWEEDFSAVKKYLDALKAQGITDFRAYFGSHPEAVADCAGMIRILDVNRAGLQMYGAANKEELIEETIQILSKGELEHNHEDFIAIANGQTSHSWEGADETITEEAIEISLSWSVVLGMKMTIPK
jgi:DNA-binding response OmpR family regulator